MHYLTKSCNRETGLHFYHCKRQAILSLFQRGMLRFAFFFSPSSKYPPIHTHIAYKQHIFTSHHHLNNWVLFGTGRSSNSILTEHLCTHSLRQQTGRCRTIIKPFPVAINSLSFFHHLQLAFFSSLHTKVYTLFTTRSKHLRLPERDITTPPPRTNIFGHLVDHELTYVFGPPMRTR